MHWVYWILRSNLFRVLDPSQTSHTPKGIDDIRVTFDVADRNKLVKNKVIARQSKENERLEHRVLVFGLKETTQG
jgi:hypothetical protein